MNNLRVVRKPTLLGMESVATLMIASWASIASFGTLFLGFAILVAAIVFILEISHHRLEGSGYWRVALASSLAALLVIFLPLPFLVAFVGGEIALVKIFRRGFLGNGNMFASSNI